MKNIFIVLLLVFLTQAAYALKPEQILVVANSDVNESIWLAEYYCKTRAVPIENILKVPLGQVASEYISRQQYEKVLVPAIKKEIAENKPSSQIKCLLTVYGVPVKVGAAEPMRNSEQFVSEFSQMLSDKEKRFKKAYYQLGLLGKAELLDTQDSAKTESYEDILKHLDDDIKKTAKRIEYIEQKYMRDKQYDNWQQLLKRLYGPAYTQRQTEQLPGNLSKTFSFDKEKLKQAVQIFQTAQQEGWSFEKKLKNNLYPAIEFIGGFVQVISQLKSDIDRCKGIETNASIDSELSMILSDDYDLYRWQANNMQNKPIWLPSRVMMVSRLDGPSAKISAGLVDKAITAEKNGLSGKAYIDTRGLSLAEEPESYSFEFFDKSLHALSDVLKKRTAMSVVVDNTESLFTPGSCPDTALYCGWYSVGKYIDAFDFVPGAVGFHIASFEAKGLRNPKSSNWCPAMLSDGITATLGPVDEPYLQSFPEPDKFFAELLDGKCLVEAFYRTKPFNSWQMILIGDPLYKINIK
ncbi:MAG: TIGR03790 family protein [Sedimentisphaerales bacterium]|nr:TIGR03790 family protein [Sedimentisphaerales bacterium]